jgi:hypothetical protein
MSRDSSMADDETSAYEDLLAAIVTARDADRTICQLFKVLPDRNVYAHCQTFKKAILII